MHNFIILALLLSFFYVPTYAINNGKNISNTSKNLDIESIEKEIARQRKKREAKNINYSQEFDSFYDSSVDYSHFSGRVTDKDSSDQIYKIQASTVNVRFFKVGDELNFKVGNTQNGDFCRGYVRDVEKDYFVIYVENLSNCWDRNDYFRRGSILNFKADQLAQRVRDASLFRVLLLKRRENFFTQLNQVNHFLWSYDQKRVQKASEYDKKIQDLRKEKEKALNNIREEKKDKIRLQKELSYQIKILDEDLEFYRIEKEKEGKNRWSMDHHLGLPVMKRPQKLKASEK